MTKTILREEKGISYEILQEKDLEETITLLSNIFPSKEPVTKSLDITAEEFRYFAEIYCKKAAREGLSVIAKDKNNKDKIVSFIISEDLDHEQPEGIEKVGPKILALIALVDALEEDIKSNKKEGERRFHLFLGGTDKEYENRHILTILNEEIMKLAKNKHFTSAVVEPSGFATQHMFKKFGFETRNMIEYKTFLYEGKNVFKNVEGPVGIPLMEKSLISPENKEEKI
jgi:ribosomal protein S18 acetylase RimI-like enzyme